MFEIINNSGEEVLELDVLKKYVEYVVKKLEIEGALFNIIMTDDKEIKELNSKYRGIDKKTDVITFALEDEKNFVEMDHRILGDIYISIDKAISQALEYGHSLKREFCFLALHGFLHLLGYDHMEKQEEEEMFALQNKVMEMCEVNR